VSSRRRACGLTLVELLVTLVLVSLAVALVTGGIGQASAMLARVTTNQGEVYEELMARAWLRQTIATAVTPAGTRFGLKGNELQLSLWSFRPLLGSEGPPTELAWRARSEGGLEYSEGDQAMTIAALPPLARFEYQDAQRAWHPQWPVEDKDSALPVRVRVLFAGDDDPLDITVLTQRSESRSSADAAFDDE
jgi:prepilin-type N-terminal cleavage/methylation domain-containing protein